MDHGNPFDLIKFAAARELHKELIELTGEPQPRPGLLKRAASALRSARARTAPARHEEEYCPPCPSPAAKQA